MHISSPAVHLHVVQDAPGAPPSVTTGSITADGSPASFDRLPVDAVAAANNSAVCFFCFFFSLSLILLGLYFRSNLVGVLARPGAELESASVDSISLPLAARGPAHKSCRRRCRRPQFRSPPGAQLSGCAAQCRGRGLARLRVPAASGCESFRPHHLQLVAADRVACPPDGTAGACLRRGPGSRLRVL